MTGPLQPIEPAGPLKGLRVLDLSTVVAGPLAATLLADLGADVLKIELPDGRDGLRHLPPFKDGVPLWWKVGNRNKRGATLDVRTPEGRALFLELLPDFDVLVENFRPGTMDGWRLDAATLHAAQPKLTILRVTGFGQTGPYRDRPGFARVFDAMSGFAYLNGMPDGPPLNVGYPVSDAVSGLFGALGILAAMFERMRNPDAPGQEIDLSATEATFRLLDFLAIEYDQLGLVRERAGNASGYAAPSNIYLTRDGRWLSIAISAQSIFVRFAQALGRADWLDDPRYRDNAQRVRHAVALDEEIASWIAARDLQDVLDLLTRHEVTAAAVNSVADVFDDPHFRARGMLAEVEDGTLGTVRMQCVVPRFSRTPGAVRCTGPDLGADNATVYRDLGLSGPDIEALRMRGVI
jgi:crotonobetainyl-CoA:carnitine CoA-transferase CaiB-like acyl-CoA transferase